MGRNRGGDRQVADIGDTEIGGLQNPHDLRGRIPVREAAPRCFPGRPSGNRES